MAMPKILDWLDNLVAQVATNVTNIAKNASDIAENKEIFDNHAADDVRHWTTTDRQNFDRVVHFKGYFTSEAKLLEAYPTGQLGDYAIVGGTDTVWAWDDETSSWLNTTEQGIVISVNGRTGEVILTKTDVGLSNVDNTSDVNKPVSTAQKAALDKKANAYQITKAQADSFNLAGGIYEIREESITILDVTSKYWTVIVGQNVQKSGSQIWLNYDSANESHMYFRKQISSSSWTDFKEVMTNIHFEELEEKITLNTESIGNLELNKANKGNISLTQANDLNALKAGIYYVNTSYTILGYTSQFWTVIVGDWEDNNGLIAVSQIWINFQTGYGNQIFWRHQERNNGVRQWGEFSRVAKSTDIDTLQALITTNTNNITTNANNISQNTNDIAALQNEKLDRLEVSYEDLENNYSDLQGGTYSLYNYNMTILDCSCSAWNVTQALNQMMGTAFQIWTPIDNSYNTDNREYIENNYREYQTPRMFVRKIVNGQWTEFQEILTTGTNQYKGYYESLSELRNLYPNGAISGDYAIVGSALYIWNETTNSWQEVSGSGGGGGTGMWSVRQYDSGNIGHVIPEFTHIIGVSLDKQWEVNDTTGFLLNTNEVDHKVFLFETYVNMEEALDFESTTLRHDDGINIFVNNISVYSVTGGTSSDTTVTLSLSQGWNKIQILLREAFISEYFRLGIKFTDSAQCLAMDCYHAENELTQGYVPLIGNSVLEGNLTITEQMSAQSITVEDTNVVTNLNADMLDGKHATDFGSATDLANLTTQVNTNTGNILTNLEKIQDNTEQIGTNKDDISGLKTRMTTAEGNITTNKNDISSLKTKTDTTNTNVSNLTTQVNTNKTDIANLKTKTDNTNTNVTNLTSQVNTNASGIATNKSDIAALKTKTDTTNANVADNTEKIDEILAGTATIPSVENAENADNADKLGGQLPAYYAKTTDLSKYLPLTGGTISGQVKIIGTAENKPLMIRGISGASVDGTTEDILFLNYGNSKDVWINNYVALHTGNIPKAGTSTQGIVQLTNTRTSTSLTMAPTANALKVAYDDLNSALTTHKNDTDVHLTTTDRTILNKANKFKGYYETETALNNAHPTGESGDYAIVNTTDTVWIWDADKEGGAGWKDGAGKGSVISVNNMTGEVVLTKSNIGLGNVDNTSDANKPVSTAQQTALDKKVNKAGDTMTGNLSIAKSANNALTIDSTGSDAGIYLYRHGATTNVSWIINNSSGTVQFGAKTYEETSFVNYLSLSKTQFVVNETTDSTTSTSGGLLAKGGLGVAKAINAGTSITATTQLKTKSGVVNFNDKANVQYNSTEECIEFIFS